MNEFKDENSIKSKILREIKSGDLKMKPKIVFIFKIVSLIIVASLLVLFLIFLISFGFYANKLPWGLLVIILILFTLVEILIYKFKFGYHRPIMYSLALILLIIILAGFVVHTTPLHDKVSCFCNKNQVPIIGDLYEKYIEDDIVPTCNCGNCNHFPQELK